MKRKMFFFAEKENVFRAFVIFIFVNIFRNPYVFP